MTREELIRMAREAGIDAWWNSGNEQRETLQEHLERFAALVAAAEREAVIKAAVDQGFVAQAYAHDFAAAIDAAKERT